MCPDRLHGPELPGLAKRFVERFIEIDYGILRPPFIVAAVPGNQQRALGAPGNRPRSVDESIPRNTGPLHCITLARDNG